MAGAAAAAWARGAAQRSGVGVERDLAEAICVFVNLWIRLNQRVRNGGIARSVAVPLLTMMLRQISFADNNVGKENGQLTVAKGSAGLSARKGKGLGARKGRLPPSTHARRRRSTWRLRSPARQAVPARAAPHSSMHTHTLPSCLRNPTFCALACCRPLARPLQEPPVRQLFL